MRTYVLTFVSIALVLAVGPSDVLAQRASGGGATGSSSFRSGGGFSSGGFGQSSFGQSSLLDSTGQLGRESRQPGQFVGGDADQARNFVGSTQSGGGQQGASGNRGSGGGRGSSRGGGRSGGNQRAEVRVSLSLGFNIAMSRADAGAKLARRMEESSWLQARSPLEVRIDSDGTATLIGSVATEHDRVLAQRLTMLEGGVWRVRNELIVAPSSETGEEQPAPTPSVAAPTTSGS